MTSTSSRSLLTAARAAMTALLALVSLTALSSAAQAAPVSGQGNWETTLQARDINRDGVVDAYFDTGLNITWLADWNANGPMSWFDATAWAGALDVHGVTGWRLPSTSAAADGRVRPDPSSSEMAHMYYVTWGNVGYPDAGYGLSNTADFINVLDSTVYWSGTDVASDPNLAWYFYSFLGFQDLGGYVKSAPLYAVAVRDGDVQSVPEPQTPALLGQALLALCLTRRRGATRQHSPSQRTAQATTTL